MFFCVFPVLKGIIETKSPKITFHNKIRSFVLFFLGFFGSEHLFFFGGGGGVCVFAYQNMFLPHDFEKKKNIMKITFLYLCFSHFIISLNFLDHCNLKMFQKNIPMISYHNHPNICDIHTDVTNPPLKYIFMT